MRLLAIDHFAMHDFDALRCALKPGEEMKVISYEPFRFEALRIFPESVATGMEAYAAPEHTEHRERYARVLRDMLEDEFTAWPFDGLLLPSDTFFYVRAAREVCHDLGVPLLVAQKETTISPNTMRAQSEVQRRFAPPLADRMTVCSERHKEFWLRSGGDSGVIDVVGQPRFDFYARPEEWPSDVGYGCGGPVALLLSYFVDAYHPDAPDGRSEPVWEPMHLSTEKALWELAREGWRVLVKPHPQQGYVAAREMEARFRATVGPLANERVFVVDPLTDARPLIVASDVMVGFQSTALLEGMLAGRPVIYTGWDPEAVRLSGELLPFAEWDDLIDVVPDGPAIASTARERLDWTCDPSVLARRRAIAEEFLGPLDGGASERTVEILRAEVARFAANRDAAVEQHRHVLAHRRRPLRLGRRTRAGARHARRHVGALLGR